MVIVWFWKLFLEGIAIKKNNRWKWICGNHRQIVSRKNRPNDLVTQEKTQLQQFSPALESLICLKCSLKKNPTSVLMVKNSVFPVLFPMNQSIDSWLKHGRVRDAASLSQGRSKACSNSTGGSLRTASVQ